MEDENGLELSLGLGCGGSSAKSKGKNGSSSENRSEEGDRSNKLVDDFKSFLHDSTQKQELSVGSQASDSVKPQENFFNDLSKANANIGLWGSSSRPSDIEEEKRSEVGNKRKSITDELSNPKKHERDSSHPDFNDKKSHISITTDDGSTAENEDVAESGVEGSSSRLSCGVSEGQKRANCLSENLNFGVPFSVRPTNITNLPYSGSTAAPATSGHAIQGMMQVIPTSNGEQRMGPQSSNSGSSPVLFGYSPIQLPTLDKDNSWGLASHLQQVHPAYAGRGPPNSEKQNEGLRIAPASMQVMSRISSEPALYDRRALERSKGDGKHIVTEEGSSSQIEDTISAIRPKDPPGASTTEGVLLDFSAIKPGIASDLKFGGCGSYPNLPWVSTTGTGPHGRTISGVTYKFSTNQIKIVCACHGSHMSPEEFVRHASEENVEPDNGGGLASFLNTNPAASAQS